jgi:hypothetical protein
MPILSPLLVIIPSLLWVAFAVWIGLTAERRGYSGLLWFGLAIFTTPIVALVLLALITPRQGQRRPPDVP